MNTDIGQMQHPLGLRRLGYTGLTLEQPALQWSSAGTTRTVAEVIEEIPVALVYNGVPHVVMMATPSDLEDFAVGFSLTEELVGTADDVKGIEIQRYSLGVEVQLMVTAACEAVIATRSRSLTGRTGCGICGSATIEGVLKRLHPVPAGPVIAPAAIHRAMTELTARQPLNERAGTVHAAGWARSDGTVTTVREDVGRHNALDKLVGALARAGGDRTPGFVVVTSRASFEMVQKATVLGARLLAAISGPTGLAVRVAEQAGLTLVGFTRGGRHTVYTHDERLTEDGGRPAGPETGSAS
jgi:FdhD protein